MDKDSISYQIAALRKEVATRQELRTGKLSLSDIILLYIEKFGAASADLIADVLGINLVTARARVTELHNQGLIHHTSKRYTASGRLQWVFRV